MAFFATMPGDRGEDLRVREVSLGLSELRVGQVERRLSRDDRGLLRGHVPRRVRLNLGQVAAERDELRHLLRHVVLGRRQRLPEGVDVGARRHRRVHVLIEVGLGDGALRR